MTSGLHPAVPHLSALASRFTLHQFVVQHLLCYLFVFRLLSPVTDSDKLIKAHETKKVSDCAIEVFVFFCHVRFGRQKKAAKEAVKSKLGELFLSAAGRGQFKTRRVKAIWIDPPA